MSDYLVVKMLEELVYNAFDKIEAVDIDSSTELLEILNEIHSERAFQKINKKGETS